MNYSAELIYRGVKYIKSIFTNDQIEVESNLDVIKSNIRQQISYNATTDEIVDDKKYMPVSNKFLSNLSYRERFGSST